MGSNARKQASETVQRAVRSAGALTVAALAVAAAALLMALAALVVAVRRA